MKLLQILKEEGTRQGLEIAEVAIVKVYATLEATAPRLMLEGEGVEKVIAGVLTTALPILKVTVEKIADLNKDGQIG